MARSLYALLACIFLVNAEIDYDIVLERLEVLYMNTSFVTGNASISKFNKTTKAMSHYFTVLKDVPYDTVLNIKVEALIDNRYQKLPFGLSRNHCDLFKMELQYFKDEIFNGINTYPPKCPIKKGSYFVKDFVPPTKNIPSTVNPPWRHFVLHISVVTERCLVWKEDVYFSLDPDAVIARRYSRKL